MFTFFPPFRLAEQGGRDGVGGVGPNPPTPFFKGGAEQGRKAPRGGASADGRAGGREGGCVRGGGGRERSDTPKHFHLGVSPGIGKTRQFFLQGEHNAT
jgi:hypothetical protein